MSVSNVCYLDYFVGGVPASFIFKLSLDDLKMLVNTTESFEYVMDTAYEVCLIGLVSYTEAFFKNHFASLINIYNPLVEDFSETRGNVNISALDILEFEHQISINYGCLISEQYNFGSGKNINGLYMDLVKITPFSKDELKKYNQLLGDRNLLVHHGGIFTSKYSRQKMKRQEVKGRVFLDSLKIQEDDFLEWCDFIYSVAKKTVKVTKRSLEKIIEDSSNSITNEQKKAIKALDWELEQ